ncbi:unnamed protein product [Mycena citricolor]|uniref:Uncharacterized protein n=1 Tax=Mycena citricolor TaxID=2018698 RepID=A0AAD2JWW2_9AGAR|nr:unnamed protein product [Mycena citricolor]
MRGNHLKRTVGAPVWRNGFQRRNSAPRAMRIRLSMLLQISASLSSNLIRFLGSILLNNAEPTRRPAGTDIICVLPMKPHSMPNFVRVDVSRSSITAKRSMGHAPSAAYTLF